MEEATAATAATAVEATAEEAKEAVVQAAEMAADVLGQKVTDTVSSAVSGTVDTVTSAVTEKLGEVGESVSEGVGVQGVVDKVGDTISNVSSDIADAAPGVTAQLLDAAGSVGDQAVVLMTKICGSVGASAEYMWPIWVKKTVADWVGLVLGFLIMSGAVMWVYKKLFPTWARISEMRVADPRAEIPDFISFGKVLTAVVAAGLFLVAVINMMELSHVVAPQARALEDLIILVKEAKAQGL
jgi:hypothetical protein